MLKHFLLCAALAFGVCVFAPAEDIVVGTNAEFMPFEFTDSDSNIIGYDIDIIKAVGRAAGVNVIVKNFDFDTLIEELDSGKIDAVVSGMTITEVRSKRVDFSDPYYDASQVIVVLEKGPSYASMDDIKDKRVGVQLGTTGGLMAEEALGKNNDNLKQFTKYNEVFTELRLKRIDAVVVDLPVANAYLKKVKGLRISSEPMSQEQYGIAVKKGNTALLEKINAGLAAIRESGEYEEITNKWFQE